MDRSFSGSNGMNTTHQGHIKRTVSYHIIRHNSAAIITSTINTRHLNRHIQVSKEPTRNSGGSGIATCDQITGLGVGGSVSLKSSKIPLPSGEIELVPAFISVNFG